MAKKKKARLKIIYNAPVTLTFSIVSVILLAVTHFPPLSGLISTFFMVPGKIGSGIAFNWTNPLDYFLLFTHVLGHSDWNHLLANLSFILLLGPLLEERYGSPMLILMMSITALVTGVINVCFIPRPMLGASGIAFMMILLSSFTAISKHQIPLTFLLVLALYMGREFATGFKNQDISSLAHITGGLCGSLFGFLTAHSPKGRRSTKAADTSSLTQPSDNKAPVSKSSATSAPSPAGSVAKAPPSAKKTATKKAQPQKSSKDDSFDIYEQEATILFGEDEV